MAGLNKLTARKVASHKTAGRIADGGGLYLRVRGDGTKTWVFKRMRNGIAKEVGLGAAAQISLTEARDRAARCRSFQDAGRDPALAIKMDIDGITFAEAARRVIAIKEPEWRSDKTKAKWERNIFKYAANLCPLPVSQIERSHIVDTLQPIWLDKNVAARTARSHIEIVLAYATVQGWREGENPARWKNNLDFLLAKAKPKVKHHAAMPYNAVPDFAAHLVKASEPLHQGGAPRALLFLILTAVRSKEVRTAMGPEIDLTRGVWNVPADHTKRGHAHIVPLSDEALSLITKPITADLLFPGVRNKPLSDNTLRLVIRRAGIDEATAHGFRSSFRSFTQDVLKVPDEIAEMCLGHLVGSEARRAYARSDVIDQRRVVLDAWGKHVMSKVH